MGKIRVRRENKWSKMLGLADFLMKLWRTIKDSQEGYARRKIPRDDATINLVIKMIFTLNEPSLPCPRLCTTYTYRLVNRTEKIKLYSLQDDSSK